MSTRINEEKPISYRTFSIRVEEKLYMDLKDLAKREKRSLGSMTVYILEKCLKQEENNKRKDV